MSQPCVTSYYNARKRQLPGKGRKESIQESKSAETAKTCTAFFSSLCSQGIIKSPGTIQTEEQQKDDVAASTKRGGRIVSSRGKSRKQPPAPRKVQASKAKGKSRKKALENDIRDVFQAQIARSSSSGASKSDAEISAENTADEVTRTLNLTYDLETTTLPASEVPVLRTPKRNHSDPDEPSVNSKKKKCNMSGSDALSVPSGAGGEKTPEQNMTKVCHRPAARKRLELGTSPTKQNKPENRDVPAAESAPKLKLLSSGNLEELREKLQKFDKTYQKLKEIQSNKYKIASAISPAPVPTDAKPAKSEETAPKDSIPCYQKFLSLVSTGPSSLPLPYKYRILHDTFRCSDTVVSMLHNRKETCTFEKLKNGVQDMTRRAFSKSHLGQIKTVFPSAYSYSIEKNSSSVINRNPGTPLYQLVVTPVLTDTSSPEDVSQKHEEKTQSSSFTPMTPANLIQRSNIFSSHLLGITKQQHQVFLSKLSPPISVPMEKLTKWHPKFCLNDVPEIEPSPLPEPPDSNKVHTARDVLNKIKGTVDSKIERALESVAEKYKSSQLPQTGENQKIKVTSGLLKGISMDLLQRIRARENMKIAQDMTTKPGEKKRQEMLERIPELVRILRSFFITERKAAVSLDDATKKLTDSYHTALGPDEVLEHIQLMAEIFPSWLSLIPIRKGTFVKIDKTKDINVLLANMPRK